MWWGIAFLLALLVAYLTIVVLVDGWIRRAGAAAAAAQTTNPAIAAGENAPPAN
jgi:hypothetical protein